MGKAAKITRGGNKSRVNPGRAETKQKALGRKAHVISAKEAADSRLALMKKSQRIAGELRSKAVLSAGTESKQSIVRMTPRMTPLESHPSSPRNSMMKNDGKENEEK